MGIITRRTFAHCAAGALALGANERPVLALIGARNQGRWVAGRAIAAGAEIKTICDIDNDIIDMVAPHLEKAQGRRPGAARDFRAVLDDKDVDAVIIAAPDHWHTHIALAACQAGKDVYVEKPLSQTIAEGKLIREAARKYGRVVQVGTQRRSGAHYRSAAEFVASGKLGKLCLIRAWMNQLRPSVGNPPDTTPPASADYDRWLGPAPLRPFNPLRFHYNWRFFWDYGNTELGNQGVHMLDTAIWAIQMLRGVEDCLPTRVSDTSGIYWLKDAKEVPDTQTVVYDYTDFQLVWELRSFGSHKAMEGAAAGTAFYGSDAALIVDDRGWRVFGPKNEILASAEAAPLLHEKNFLECLKSRGKPNGDVEIGRLSTMLCHLGNISCRLKRDVRFDPRTETFGADAEANALLSKTYRQAWPLPRV